MVFSANTSDQKQPIINNTNMNNNFQSFFYQAHLSAGGSNTNNHHQQPPLLANQSKSPANNYLPGTANGQINNNLHDYLYQLQQQKQSPQQPLLPLSNSSSEEELSDPTNDFINTYHHPSTESLYGSSLYEGDEQEEFMDESKILQMNGISIINNSNNEIDHQQSKHVLNGAQSSPSSSSASVNILNQINHQHHHNTTTTTADKQVGSSSINYNGGLYQQQQPLLITASQLQQFFPVKQKIKKAILYIDLDNFPISRPSEYLEMLAKIKSKYSIDVTAKKIFGDLNQFEKLPVDFQFSHQLIICPKVSSRKNTTDIALTIEVIKDLERKKPFDVFIIASSDSDFVPVVKAIRDEGKECWILPSHNYPHQTLMSICNGILDFNSQQNVSNPLQELNIPSKPSQVANKTSPNTSPRKKEVLPVPKVHVKTNHIPPSQNKLSIVEVKSMITKIIRKLEFSGVKIFNLSCIHEQLRDKSIIYHHYGYPTFRALFEEWSQENPKYKFERNEKDGQLSFAQEVHPNILHRPPQTVPQTASTNLTYSNVKILPKPTSSTSLSSSNESPEPSFKPKGSRKALKNAITQILKNLHQANPKGSFNMSFVNERMRERSLKYKEHGYDSMKTLFTEWKQEHPTAFLGVREKSGELYFLPTFSL
ncbi:predicted protein [Naegleria gruberi]|uniref:Predicted protein n=1 Tax=Naegleria gruberi TaxID=5762 RepID=D2VNF1_NAEGR|nr:uncharacterized protein NAEGRDRAFT_70475 [Naegleria gruberi]EFC41648.1 predicted protein [Naegleria gruberi]|eukprot:XP_002674392.1 predicted protein [Naegleria gruberi strain NEG-M]